MKFLKNFYITSLLLLLTFPFFGQSIIRTTIQDTTNYWENKNIAGFDVSQISFVNWNAGGANSVSGLLKGNFTRKYQRDNVKWLSEMIIRYGINKQDGIELRKTDDVFQVNSTFGYRKDSTSNWYTSAKFNFNTQFTNGYSYPNTKKAISKPLAPAFIFLGVGSEYVNKEKKLTVYVSPLTMKTTLVLDQTLANQGAFGVKKAVYDLDDGSLISEGEMYRFEFGLLLTSKYKIDSYKNIIWENRISLYSDYVNNFGNVDINWQLQFDLVVNEYVRANIGTHIIYDDDIKSRKQFNGQLITDGPKIQLKQILSVGLVYSF